MSPLELANALSNMKGLKLNKQKKAAQRVLTNHPLATVHPYKIKPPQKQHK